MTAAELTRGRSRHVGSPGKRQGIFGRTVTAGLLGLAAALSAGGCCDCGKDKAAGAPASELQASELQASELRAVQFAADVPAVQPKLPDVPPKVPELPPVPPPSKPPVPPPPPGRLPEQPGGQPDRPKTPGDDLGEANKKLWEQNRELRAPVEEKSPGQIKHVVVLWLKRPGDKDGRKALMDGRDVLRTIPGVVDVSVGECLTSDRKVVDSSYDVAMVITLKDEAALKGYGPHPVHQKLLADVIKPNVEKYVVYDFVAK